MTLDKRTIFLVDGLGAVVSALSLGLVLPAFQNLIGMPKGVLYLLACLAVGLAIFSLSRFFFADHDNPIWLKLVIIGNLSYCALSAFFLVTYFQQLTYLGLTYFILEKVIVLGIVFLEARFLKTLS
jgi:hypothetical protein